jgi:hypothetical protein
MQAHRRRAAAAHSGYLLACSHLLPVADQQFLIVAIGGNVVIVMFNQNQVAIATQLAAGIHHPACACRINRRSALAANINAFITARRAGENGSTTLPLAGQRQQREPAGGTITFGALAFVTLRVAAVFLRAGSVLRVRAEDAALLLAEGFTLNDCPTASV